MEWEWDISINLHPRIPGSFPIPIYPACISAKFEACDLQRRIQWSAVSTDLNTEMMGNDGYHWMKNIEIVGHVHTHSIIQVWLDVTGWAIDTVCEAERLAKTDQPFCWFLTSWAPAIIQVLGDSQCTKQMNLQAPNHLRSGHVWKPELDINFRCIIL